MAKVIVKFKFKPYGKKENDKYNIRLNRKAKAKRKYAN